MTNFSVEDDLEEDRVKLLESSDPENTDRPARKSSYNEITPRSMLELERVRKLPFFKRNFRKIGKGSLRGTIITWVRISMGIGGFAVPFYVKEMGALIGFIIIVIAAIINYNTFMFIFESSQYTGINTYPDIVKKLLGRKIYKIFKFTMLFEFISVVLLYTLASWNLFQFFAYKFGIFKEEWLVDENTLEFDQYNINVFMYRVVFFVAVFFISFRNLLQETLESTRFISLLFIIVLFVLIFYLLFQAPFFINYFEKLGELKVTFIAKQPRIEWVECFYAILLTYNIHVMALDLKKELFNPTIRRLKKACRISISIEAIGGILLGITGYLCLGDKFTPSLLFIRKPINAHSLMEIIMTIILFIFLICVILGISTLNVPLRRFIIQASGIKTMTRKLYLIFSLVPFIFILVISIVFPYIINVLTIFGLTIYNINAYLIPLLMKNKIRMLEKRKFSSYMFLFGFLIMLTLSVIGTCVNIKKLVSN